MAYDIAADFIVVFSIFINYFKRKRRIFK